MNKPPVKLKYSKKHFDRGTQVFHPNTKEDVGTIVDILGDVTESGITDVKYTVIWENAGYAEEWHQDLVEYEPELENTISLPPGKDNGTTSV